MRKKFEITFILVIFGIFLTLSAISNFNVSSDQEHDKEILEFREEKNLRTAGLDIVILSPEDKIYTGPMSGYYLAPYSFDDQVGTNGTDISWIDADNNNIASIVSDVNGHKNVLKLSTPVIAGVSHNITTERNNGTIEFYVMTPNNGNGTIIQIFDNSPTDAIELIFWPDGNIYYNPGPVFIQNYNASTWYHIKIEFNCSDDWHLWINNVSMDGGSGYEFKDSPINMNSINILVAGIFYYDAFGYSWDDDYEIGDNLNEGLLLSFENNTNLDWMGYSLDGQANRTILGNTTIPMPDYGQHTIQVFGNNSLGNIYESNIRNFYISPITINTPENKTYREPMSGYYPATYSFDDQEAGTTGTDIDFIDYDNLNKTSIVSEIEGHKSILEFKFSPGYDMVHMLDANPANGTIEFYIRATQTNNNLISIADDNLFDSIYLRFKNDGNLCYEGPGGSNIQEYNASTWYHFKIEFDCGIAGDGTNDWHLWIDNISMDGGSGYNFAGSPTNMDRIYFWVTEGPGIFYYDAFGYSWDDNYEIGDNLDEGLLLSFENSTNLDWMGYSLDGQPNKTILGNTTILMPDYGHHTIQVFGNTTLGEIFKSEVRQFTIDSSEPNVVIVSPKAGTYGPPSLFINASITDSLSIISSAKAMINASKPFNISMTQGVGNYWSCIWDDISDYMNGVYKITIWVIDDGGNINQTQFIVITFDKSKPNVAIVSPIAGTYGPPSLLINVSLTDSISNISSAKAMINAVVPFNISMIPGLGNYWSCIWDNISAYSNGVYIITIWAIDEGGNVNKTQSIVITIYNPPIVGAVGGDGNESDDSSDSVKDNSDLLFIIIIILASAFGILAVISVLLIKKRSKLLMLPKSKVPQICPICNKKHKEFWILCKECYDKQEKITISIICPTCKTKNNIKVPKLVVEAAKNLMTLSVPRGLMCGHTFQAFVDKQFNIRGYQKVDFESISK